MNPWKVVAAGLLTAAGCCGCTLAAGSGTGLEGRIMKGPMCPGPRIIGRPCPDKPAEGSFLLVDAADRVVARFRTDGHGRFRTPVPPGTYFVVPDLREGEHLLMGRREVAVPAKGWGCVELVFDTGMR